MTALLLSDDYSPRVVGDLTPFQPQAVDHNNKPFDISGVDWTKCGFVMVNQTNGVKTTGAGTFALVAGQAANGLFTYTPDATDVDTPGLYDVQFMLFFPWGPQHFDVKELELRNPL